MDNKINKVALFLTVIGIICLIGGHNNAGYFCVGAAMLLLIVQAATTKGTSVMDFFLISSLLEGLGNILGAMLN